MEETQYGQLDNAPGNEEDVNVEGRDLEEIREEEELIDNEATQIAKERAENSNKISKALIVYGFESWLALEPSNAKWLNFRYYYSNETCHFN